MSESSLKFEKIRKKWIKCGNWKTVTHAQNAENISNVKIVENAKNKTK